MSRVLVDSNVILDVLTEDQTWFEWSSGQLADCPEQGGLLINPIIGSDMKVVMIQSTYSKSILSNICKHKLHS